MSTPAIKKAQAAGPDKISIVTAPPYGRCYEGALARLERDRSIQVQECDTRMDAVTLLRKLDFAVLLCHSSTPEELVKQVGLLKLLAPQIKQKRVRVMATTGVKHESAATSLNFYGAQKTLTEPISEKALQFMLERMAHALAQVRARAKSKADSKGDEGGPEAKTDQESEGGGRRTPQLVRRPALTIASDFWITAELEVKRIHDRWLIHLVGPSPDTGKWLRVQNEPGRQGTILWQWVPNEPDRRALYKEEGEWFFRGQRPEFQELEWLFVGVAPELYFKSGDKVQVKIQIDERSNLLVARDSEASRAILPLVKESLVNIGEKTFRTKKEEDDGETGDLREREPSGKKKKKLSRKEAEDLFEVKEGPPLKLASDCWILGDGKPKRIAQHWVARMLGPTPNHGRWVRAGSSDLFWAWEPHNPESDPFIKDQGFWVSRGLSPKFLDDRWLFVADRPGLSFMQGGKSLGSKLEVDVDGNLIVAKDSEQALAKQPMIEESLRKIFKNKAEQEGGAKPEGEGASKGDKELEEVLEAERRKGRGKAVAEDAAEGDEREDLDPDEVEISGRKKKKARLIGEEDDDELELRSSRADRDGEEPDGEEPDGEEPDPPSEHDESSRDSGDSGEEESVSRKKRRRRGSGDDESDEVYAVQKGPSQGKEMSIELDAPEEGKELEAVQEGPGEGKELSAREGGEDEGEELEATQEGPDEGEELEATQEGPDESEELEATQRGRKRKKGGSVRFEEGEPVDHGKDRREDEEPEDIGSVTREDSSVREGDVTAEKPARPEDAKGIRAPGPPGPTLTPLALAFLMAELVNDRTKGLAHGASRYCAYLSASCGGLQIELWCKSAGGWLCAASSEGTKEKHEIEAAGVDAAPSTKLHGTDTLVTPIRFRGAVVGALVIHGHGTDGVKHDYAEAAARVACGVVFSFASGAVTVAAA